MPRTHRTRTVAALAAAATLLTLAASPATAQRGRDDDGPVELNPPQPDRDPTAPTFLTMGSLIILGAAVIGAGLMPSKRGHQD
jgi:hypothetical protein